MMNLRSLVLIVLFVCLSVVCADDAAAAQIECGKDCADFVATVVKKEKSTLEGELSKCQKQNEEFKKEHEDTVASLKQELKQLQEHSEKSAAMEKELRELNKDIQRKYSTETEQQKEMLKKASELAQKSQQEVIEAKIELQNLIDTMSSTRINFKLIGEDIAAVWKKIKDKVQSLLTKEEDETKSEM